MKKVFLVAMVLITAFCSAFSKNANSFTGQNVFIDGEKLKLIEVPEFTPVDEEIKSFANTVIYQLVDIKEFDEFVNSPNRSPYATVLGVDMEQVKELEVARKNSNEYVQVHFIKTSPPLIQPNVWHSDVAAEGYDLSPGYGNKYGTYSGCIYVSIALSWSPSNVPIDVGIQYTDSPNIIAHTLTGGSGATGFNVDPSKSFLEWVINPPLNQVNISKYQGTISLWFQ